MISKKILLTLSTLLVITSLTGLAGCSEEKKQEPSSSQQQTPTTKPPQQGVSVPAVPATKIIQGEPIVPNPLDILVLVNKTRHLASDFVPTDLVEPNIPFSFSGKSPKKTMRLEAAHALEKLFDAAKADGIDIVGQSGYRSYSTQKQIYTETFRQKGESANSVSAQPGQSEHQTGLAMDISSEAMGYTLEPEFGDTIEGKWLAKNAAKYGFIIRYPKGKESITGYNYEPWHVRYVGVTIAQDITAKGLTLEEYLTK